MPSLRVLTTTAKKKTVVAVKTMDLEVIAVSEAKMNGYAYVSMGANICGILNDMTITYA